MSLLDLFDLSLIGRSETQALEYEHGDGGLAQLTFGELEQRSNRLAHALWSRGLRHGDRLAFCLVNRPEIIDLWIACMKIGAIVVPINVLYRAREIQHIVQDAEPLAVITTDALAREFPSGVECWNVDVLNSELPSFPHTRDDGFLWTRCHAATPAALVYTSGTTGASKGAVLTHGNFSSNALTLVTCWQITSDDRYLAALPLFHVHGLGNGVHAWLVSGCHMKLVERFDVERAARWFEQYQPTLFFGVPTMYVRLLEMDALRARTIGARMRLFVCGSAPLPAAVLDAFHERFGHVILERYGMTETLMNVSNPYVGERRAGTVGLPLPLTAVRLCDNDGRDVPNGESGELLVRGPNVCDGYWRRPDLTEIAFRDGWFRTGDIGVQSADGYITLQGRRSDLIISGGFNIYPREIEEVLSEFQGIREVAVVGVPDAMRGEVPIAYVVCDAAIDLSAIAEHVRTQLASFKVPRGFMRVDTLPRTALGKVQRHLLPAWLPA
ncbi:MAG: AMP-binding protein [Gemmatimonadaceae bacterium]